MDGKYKIISENIRLLRKINKLTQDQLASAIYKSTISIRKYESGKCKIPFSVITLMSLLFNIPPIELFRYNTIESTNYNNELLTEYHMNDTVILLNSSAEYKKRKYLLSIENNALDSYQTFVESIAKQEDININNDNKIIKNQLNALYEYLYETTKLTLTNLLKKEDKLTQVNK